MQVSPDWDELTEEERGQVGLQKAIQLRRYYKLLEVWGTHCIPGWHQSPVEFAVYMASLYREFKDDVPKILREKFQMEMWDWGDELPIKNMAEEVDAAARRSRERRDEQGETSSMHTPPVTSREQPPEVSVQ